MSFSSWSTVLADKVAQIWLPFLLSHISMILHQIKVLRNAGLQIKSNLAGQMTHTSQPATATEQTIARLVSVCKKRAVSAIAILTIVCFDVGILLLPIIKPWELTLEAPLYQTFIGSSSLSDSLQVVLTDMYSWAIRRIRCCGDTNLCCIALAVLPKSRGQTRSSSAHPSLEREHGYYYRPVDPDRCRKLSGRINGSLQEG